jgi:hypothetical protein
LLHAQEPTKPRIRSGKISAISVVRAYARSNHGAGALAAVDTEGESHTLFRCVGRGLDHQQ